MRLSGIALSNMLFSPCVRGLVRSSDNKYHLIGTTDMRAFACARLSPVLGIGGGITRADLAMRGQHWRRPSLPVFAADVSLINLTGCPGANDHRCLFHHHHQMILAVTGLCGVCREGSARWYLIMLIPYDS